MRTYNMCTYILSRDRRRRRRETSFRLSRAHLTNEWVPAQRRIVEETLHRVRDTCAVSRLAYPSRRQRRRQLRLAVLPRQCCHRVMIVRHMPERHVPGAPGKFEDRIARVRRAGLDEMRKRMDIAVAGRTDAAGIDDQAAVAKPDRACDMGVAAEDQRLRDTQGGLLDRI